MVSILRVRSVWTGVAGAPAYCNLYFAGDPPDSQGVSDAVAAWLGAIDNLQTTALTWNTDEAVASIDSVTGDITGLSPVTPATGTGTLTSDIVPRASQALVHLRTGVFQGGREIRGRVNIPYLTETANGSTGVVVSGAISTIQVATNTLLDGVGFSQLCVWSRLSGECPPVLSADVNDQWAVLRSRRD